MEDYKLYRFTFPNGKLYFGITGQVKVTDRWGTCGGNYQGLVGNAIKKYGWDSVQKDVLFDGLDKQSAMDLEIELIEQYDTTDTNKGYNIAKGGYSCSGYHPTEETREKLRQYAKNRTPEHRRKLSECQKGRIFTDEHRQKISESNKGKHHTEEAKQKIAYASKHRSPEAKENHRRGLLGHYTSPETRKKIGDAQRGVPKPDWLKERFSIAAKNRSFEAQQNINKSHTKLTLCVTTNKLYDSVKLASEGEGINRDNISIAAKEHRRTKGKEFIIFPVHTQVEDVLLKYPDVQHIAEMLSLV